MTPSFTLTEGDCLDVLRTMPENSVDSVVTDPPYHLTSIVKRFGAAGSVPAKAGKTGAYARASKGFMGQTWDGGDIAFRAELWAEVLRVLKPGGHCAAFSGTRTYHRMACAIEDAGFEIRDQLAWTYGSGFPKSHDAGEGRGTALKPAWEPICLARKPLIGTVAANVLAHGTGALNIDACRVESDGGAQREGEASQDRRYIEKGGTNFAMKPGPRGGDPAGRWPANLIHDGSPEVLAAFPKAGGAFAPVRGTEPSSKTDGIFGEFTGRAPSDQRDGGGSAARFFYCAKATKEDRGEGNTHPTVKPTNLMRWLCRLITPPGGLVLDPFTGSGSTGRGAMLEGLHFHGIELTPEYLPIARRRIEQAQETRAGFLPL